jgi:molecular chaperone DnaK (HSP70)
MLDAAELGGYNVLTLVHENTAAGLLYGIDTKTIMNEVPKTVMFINMGSSDFEVSIVRYNKTEVPKKKNPVLTIEVLVEEGTAEAGGMNMNEQLVRIMASKFDRQDKRKGKPSVLSSPRSIRRLFKESNNVKEVLSSNREMNIKIPELFEYDEL